MTFGAGKSKAAVLVDCGDPKPKSGVGETEVTQEPGSMLDLIYKVSKKVGSLPELARLVEQVTQMSQRALNAAASSVLLFDGGELLFEVARGRAGKALKQVRLSAQTGIAGWVARHGKPLVVNDVTLDQRFNASVDETTGFATRSVICVPLMVERRVIGVIEVLNKLDENGFSEQDLEALVAVASTAAMAIENVRLHKTVVDAYKSTIKALAAAIDAKDPYTCGHSQRVMEYALLQGRSLSFSDDNLAVLEYGGILHDVGKIGIADTILSKPGSLTEEEWAAIRQHPIIGANILQDIPFLEKVRQLVRYHHERYDGHGYPDGLRGEGIPMGARVLAVADAFDTMTTARSYRAALTVEYAVAELRRCCRTQFCPVAVEAFICGWEKH